MLLVTVTAAAGSHSGHGAGNALSASPASAAGRYSDPFAYCRAAGTVDRPDARYSGRRTPPAIILGLEHALGLRLGAEQRRAFSHGVYWRCMDGKVYACAVGANLPCQSKADVDRRPTEAEKRYCQANHDAYVVPAYVSGHATLYEWRCSGSQAVATKALYAVDQQGYRADIWYEIPPPPARQASGKPF